MRVPLARSGPGSRTSAAVQRPEHAALDGRRAGVPANADIQRALEDHVGKGEHDRFDPTPSGRRRRHPPAAPTERSVRVCPTNSSGVGSQHDNI